MANNKARIQPLKDGNLIQEFLLEKRSISIGQDPGNEIKLENLPIPGFQARLFYNGMNWILETLSPANPNKSLSLEKTQTLTNGQQFIVGQYSLRLLLAETQGQITPASPGPGNPTSQIKIEPGSQVPPTMLLTDKNRDGQEDHGFGRMEKAQTEANLTIEFVGTRQNYFLNSPKPRLEIPRRPIF